ncbi:hypothetical protein GCM10009557_93330 [Virgisporangium ochraceum]|uniref:hypothetical protein n=1 Tax=Virgisporangium ochraceum TaxID=65505 RepID=UPI0019453013|nr:hypothetical protein [Virgisporangium ochraceum]
MLVMVGPPGVATEPGLGEAKTPTLPRFGLRVRGGVDGRGRSNAGAGRAPVCGDDRCRAGQRHTDQNRRQEPECQPCSCHESPSPFHMRL